MTDLANSPTAISIATSAALGAFAGASYAMLTGKDDEIERYAGAPVRLRRHARDLARAEPPPRTAAGSPGANDTINTMSTRRLARCGVLTGTAPGVTAALSGWSDSTARLAGYAAVIIGGLLLVPERRRHHG